MFLECLVVRYLNGIRTNLCATSHFCHNLKELDLIFGPDSQYFMWLEPFMDQLLNAVNSRLETLRICSCTLLINFTVSKRLVPWP